jgi:hypothetical protein
VTVAAVVVSSSRTIQVSPAQMLVRMGADWAFGVGPRGRPLVDALFGEPVAGFLAHRHDDGQVVEAGWLDDHDAW